MCIYWNKTSAIKFYNMRTHLFSIQNSIPGQQLIIWRNTQNGTVQSQCVMKNMSNSRYCFEKCKIKTFKTDNTNKRNHLNHDSKYEKQNLWTRKKKSKKTVVSQAIHLVSVVWYMNDKHYQTIEMIFFEE